MKILRTKSKTLLKMKTLTQKYFKKYMKMQKILKFNLRIKVFTKIQIKANQDIKIDKLIIKKIK